MWHLGSISARQGLLVEARSQFQSAGRAPAGARRRRAAKPRSAYASAISTAPISTRVWPARARASSWAIRKRRSSGSKHAAADLQEKGKDADALRLLTEAAQIDPEDTDAAAAAGAGLHRARRFRGRVPVRDERRRAAERCRRSCFGLGRDDEGINVLASAADADPADIGIRVELVKRLVTRGDMAGARTLLTPEVAGNDPELLWLLAEMELRDGRIPEGTALLQQILADDPGRRDALVILGCSVAEVNPDAGYECIEVAARAAIAADEWGSAAAALNEFVNRVPNHIPALMRLVEICVDGGLEATMHSAQAQLADAYLAVGAGIEARVIAEDLVAREPWDRSNIERFRRALALLGETDIDAIIADRLSGQIAVHQHRFHVAGRSRRRRDDADAGRSAARRQLHRDRRRRIRRGRSSRRRCVRDRVKAASVVAACAGEATESHEVDLSDVLHDLREGGGGSGRASPASLASRSRAC